MSFQGELNQTNDRRRGLMDEFPETGPEVIRGAHVCLYAVRPASQGTNLYLNETEFRKQRLGGVTNDTKATHHRYDRVGFQRKSPQNNFRRIIASLIPCGTYLLESVSYIPEHHSKLPLPFVLALLNSKLAEWYFRIGSTNAMVGEYQFNALPCPLLSERQPSDRRPFRLASDKLTRGEVTDAFSHLHPFLYESPVDPFMRDIIIEAVAKIEMIERRRGEISRSDRSALSPTAQPYQDFIDRMFFAMAGLSPEEATGLEERSATML